MMNQASIPAAGVNKAGLTEGRRGNRRGRYMTDHHRCPWAENDPLLRVYHDEEWGVPQRDSRGLWEMLMLEGFQAGLAWIIVLRKREAFRDAFAGFDPKQVARFGDAEVERLMADPGIVRARAKIEATIRGAQIYCEMEDRGESFNDFCWSFTDGKVVKSDGRSWIASSTLSEQVSKEMKRRGFKFVGPTIVYAWMQAVGILNDHSVGCFRRAQVNDPNPHMHDHVGVTKRPKQ
jgi:DNA-3-methyladenine glycosylase I